MTLTLTGDQLADLMAFSAAFTVTEDAIQNLDAVSFEDEEIDTFMLLPENARMRISARLLELAETLRESLRELDGRVLQLTARG